MGMEPLRTPSTYLDRTLRARDVIDDGRRGLLRGAVIRTSVPQVVAAALVAF